jgi:putative membrane protein insertion efficiency factor
MQDTSAVLNWNATGRWVGLLMVGLYRALFGAQLGGACRFHPSCSVYAEEAIRVHGLARGLWLAGHRVFRCRPGVPGGFDPVQ